MKAVNALPGDNQILLESGTNELEVLAFCVGGLTLGVNVAKVREVLVHQDAVGLPQGHSSLVGCFRLRDYVVPCVSLHRHLGEPARCAANEAMVILTEFNQQQIGFVVDMVQRIHRIGWDQVLPVPQLFNDSHSPVTAIARIDGKLVLMLDFEMIADQVSNRRSQITAAANVHGIERGQKRVLVADDSATARHALESVLRASGYCNLAVFENGAELWSHLLESLEAEDEAHPAADLVISDVEMPQVDGLHLTRRIKEHPRFNHIPVLLYSSILTPDNYKKGQAVGADAQLTKPELLRVVDAADRLLVESRRRGPSRAPRAAEPEMVLV